MRYYLYYIVGFLPSLFFGLRFLIQWIRSEKQRRSTVDTLFWRLSLCGNILLATHYFIQLQYPFLMLQVINAFIAWRNLDFLKKTPSHTKRFALILLAALLAGVTAVFCLQQNPLWLEVPAAFADASLEINPLWHVLGIGGGILFGARFWIQWWEAEKTGTSTLGPRFWILSIVGSVTTLVYFMQIEDTVSILNTACGLVPYLRNLMLLKKKPLKGT